MFTETQMEPLGVTKATQVCGASLCRGTVQCPSNQWHLQSLCVELSHAQNVQVLILGSKTSKLKITSTHTLFTLLVYYSIKLNKNTRPTRMLGYKFCCVPHKAIQFRDYFPKGETVLKGFM